MSNEQQFEVGDRVRVVAPGLSGGILTVDKIDADPRASWPVKAGGTWFGASEIQLIERDGQPVPDSDADKAAPTSQQVCAGLSRAELARDLMIAYVESMGFRATPDVAAKISTEYADALIAALDAKDGE